MSSLKTCQQIDGTAHHAVTVVVIPHDGTVLQQQLHQLLDGPDKRRTLVTQVLVALAVIHHSTHRQTDREAMTSSHQRSQPLPRTLLPPGENTKDLIRPNV